MVTAALSPAKATPTATSKKAMASGKVLHTLFRMVVSPIPDLLEIHVPC
jgi:hypothetical protein